MKNRFMAVVYKIRSALAIRLRAKTVVALSMALAFPVF